MADPVSGSRRQWRCDWRLLLFTGLFLPLLLVLGFWQLDRAEEKQAMLEQWQKHSDSLDWSVQTKTGLEAGQPVTVSGQYGERTWLLDNRTRDGAAGYEVLTLFRPVQGRPLVVNRGWVLAPRRRDELPAITTPREVVVVSGRLSEYPEPPVLMAKPTAETGWPRRVQALKAEQVEALGLSVPAFVLRLDGRDQPGAYRADWAPDYMGPQTHYGYATQWFSLALALVILTAVASYRKTGNDNDQG
ncbi:SURF1 family protein [Marinobacter sp.]|uniref:SURF1 family protein n=1 Tax=Marinobacter sp. TaxID=50741 RepID=UPI002B47BD74|nr:SURF1 family protein [Marinobacter sp.]HKK56602.1 SURF1 family protein [Marinobacter sp.]